MKKILFENLKKRINSKLESEIFNYSNPRAELFIVNLELMLQGKSPLSVGYNKCNNDASATLLNNCKRIISNWDIRNVHQLAEILPNIVPSWIAQCNVEYVETKKGIEWQCYL